MAIDVLCLTQEQRQSLEELVMKCRFLVEIRRIGASESAINLTIDEVNSILRKFEAEKQRKQIWIAGNTPGTTRELFVLVSGAGGVTAEIQIQPHTKRAVRKIK